MGERPGELLAVAHLFLLATAWGAQLWVTFVAGFVLFRGLSRHTFGLVQSRLFPFYFATQLGCSALNLALFAAHHHGPREPLGAAHPRLQMALFFLSLALAATNASWLSRTTTKTMFKMFKGARAGEGSGAVGQQGGLPAPEGEGRQVPGAAPEVLHLPRSFLPLQPGLRHLHRGEFGLLGPALGQSVSQKRNALADLVLFFCS